MNRLRSLARCYRSLSLLASPSCRSPVPSPRRPSRSNPPPTRPRSSRPRPRRTPTTLRLIQEQLQRVDRAGPARDGRRRNRRRRRQRRIVNKEGLVLTAAHVIGRPGRRAWVELPDGRRLRGRTLGADHDADAGMIQIDDAAGRPAVRAGQRRPDARRRRVGRHHRPAGRHRRGPGARRFGSAACCSAATALLCTDCKLVGGDSGGPLFNMRARSSASTAASARCSRTTSTCRSPRSAATGTGCWRRAVGRPVRRRDDENRPLLGVAGKRRTAAA